GISELATIEINLHEARGRDLVEHQTKRIDQEVMIGTRKPGRNVREDEIIPPEIRDQSIAGRELYADMPFGLAYLRLDLRDRHKYPSYSIARTIVSVRDQVVSTSSSASRLGPSIITARVSPSRWGSSRNDTPSPRSLATQASRSATPSAM